VDAGSVVELHAVPSPREGASAAGMTAGGQWQLRRGDGCLLSSPASESCVDSVEGATAFFKAPTEGELNMAGIQFVPADSPNAPVFGTVISQPPGYIPVNGFGKPELQPILDQMLDFMKTRCIGAGVLGVSYYGQPVGVWGLGKTFGRASSTIFDPKCGTDSDDPHFPSAPNTGNQMGIMIGSVSKTVTWAAARWAFKQALAAWDTDLDVEAMSSSQLVTAQRQGDGKLRLEAWGINAAGVNAQQGSIVTPGAFKDLDLLKLSATRVVVAARTLDDTLTLYPYDVSPAGQFTALATHAISSLPGDAGDAIIQVRLVRLSDVRLLAALRRADDTVTFVAWHLAADGALTQTHAQTLATRARDLEMIALEDAPLRVVVALRAVDNRLALYGYDVAGGGQLNLIDDAVVSGEIKGLALTPLSAARFAVGVRRDDGTLQVSSWSLDASGGNLALLDNDSAGAIGDLALARIGPSGFSVVVRAANGGLKLITWVLDSAGTLTRRGDDDAGTNNGAALASVLYGSETPNALLFVAVRTGEQTLRLIAWNVTGPNPARQNNEGNGATVADYPWADNDVEALRLVGFGLPQGLLPEPARQYFGGEAPLPISLPAVTTTDDNDQEIVLCEALDAGFAEPEWSQAQVKHLLGHRTGMSKSFSPKSIDFITTYLEDIRGLSTQAQWAGQEAALRATFGAANVEGGRAALGWDTSLIENGSTDGYLVPNPTMAEWAQVFASRCLPYPYEVYRYANTSPQIMRAVVEHVTGQPFVFAEGFPQEHQASLFYNFLNSAAGVATSATNNIYPRKTALTSAADLGDPGPVARAWNGTGYYSEEWDDKRPFCTWDGSSCSFSAWKGADNGRLAWYWSNEKVPFPYGSSPLGTATGGMRAEPQSFLKFMANFWVTGYHSGGQPSSFDPFIGEPRNNNWGINGNHNGSQGGGYAYAIHYNNGVDIFVAVNQNNTRAYTKDPDDEFDANVSALYSFINSGVNSVDWDEVEPYQQIQLAP
jgi:hypothetical protein